MREASISGIVALRASVSRPVQKGKGPELTGDGLIRMMEVAYGDVQDEDKIRYEDRYGRA